MNLKQFKKQLNVLETKLLVEQGLTEDEIIMCLTMKTNELGTTCSDVEAMYISSVHKELLVIEGYNYT